MRLSYFQLGAASLTSAVHALASKNIAIARQANDGYCPLIQPAPTSYVCGIKGQPPNSNEGNYVVEIDDDADFSYCRDRCLQSGLCLGFGNGTNANGRPYCVLYHYDFLAGSIQPSQSSTVTLWSRYCWDCSAHCPPASEMNLVVNGGFEDAPSSVGKIPGWTTASGNWQIVSPGHNSAQAAEVTGRHYLALNQAFPTCPGATYFFSFDVKVVELQPPTGNVFHATTCDSDILLKNFTTANHWHTLTGFFQTSTITPENAINLAISAPLSTGHQKVSLHQRTFYDNVKVTSFTGSLNPRPGALELVKNGGFENGRLAPWTAEESSASSIVQPGLNGSAFAFNASSEIELYQPVKLKLGVAYLFSFDYKLSNAGYLIVNAGIFNGPMSQTFSVLMDGQRTGHAVRPFIASVNGTNFYVNAGPGMLIDNISLKELDI